MTGAIGRKQRGEGTGGGALVLVGVPIGNLADMSPRATQALRDADIVACEDTRDTRKLLNLLDIGRKRLIAVHDHNEADMADTIVGLLADGRRVALVSDAGMPGISDPGEKLVAAVAAAGHDVEVVPGPSAAITALVVSGLPAGRFCFEGVLPRKGSARTGRLQHLATEPRTSILYEAPHRIAGTVDDLAGVCGADRPVALARELTKLFEEVWRGTLGELAEHLATKDRRGEYVLVLGGAPEPRPATDDDVTAALSVRFAAGVDRKTAIAEVAKELGVPKRTVYDAALDLR
jgi:16S rRNA (cytidine1402-2'-O)-methyltransferase